MTTRTATTWVMRGDALGLCSCDWGCPCNFDAPPTKGWCEGSYIFHIDEGRDGETPLSGLIFGLAAHSPAAAHLGNLTTYIFIDERATPEQREALSRIARGEAGGVFAIFASLTTKMIGPEFLPIEWHFDGPRSRARAGDRIEYGVELIKNPVTGEESGFTLKFTNGLLTDQAEMMKSTIFRVNHPEMSYDHSGQYGETFHFSFSGGGD